MFPDSLTFFLKNTLKLAPERGPLTGPESGSRLTGGNELSGETHMLTEQETLLGRGLGKLLSVSGFMVMGVVSGWSLADHSDSGSCLGARALLSQDGCQREGFWEVVGHVPSPFYPS